MVEEAIFGWVVYSYVCSYNDHVAHCFIELSITPIYANSSVQQ